VRDRSVKPGAGRVLIAWRCIKLYVARLRGYNRRGPAGEDL